MRSLTHAQTAPTMADADEDLIPRSHPPTSASASSSDPNHDIDLEDEAQDFRFLVSLTGPAKSKTIQSGALPRRGEKDFEPNPTQAQAGSLNASREAMHDALSVERVHPPRSPLVGQYLPYQKDWRRDTPTDKIGGGGRCVVVEKFSTTYSRNMGVADWRNWAWLLPEEALFLLERGTLDVRWPDEETKSFEKDRASRDTHVGVDGGDSFENLSEEPRDDADGIETGTDLAGGPDTDRQENDLVPNPHKMHLRVGEVPMSLQGAYASLIGKSGLTLERYNVYAGLKRLGYIVQRAPAWTDAQCDDHEPQPMPNGHSTGLLSESLTSPARAQSLTPPVSLQPAQPSAATSLINRLVAYLFTPKPRQYNPSHGPLLHPGIYRNYNDIFRALTLIKYHATPVPIAPSASTPSTSSPMHPYTISYNVYKPSPNTKFRKSSPTTSPDFRICVLDSRTTSVPDLSQLSRLLASMPPDSLPTDKKMENRLKHGQRNVILAVVDCGIVSYLRVADMVSGTEGRLFETKGAAGGKRGGSWQKRGGGWRGRGRGGKR